MINVLNNSEKSREKLLNKTLQAQAVIDDVVCIDLFYGFGRVVGVVRIDWAI